MTQLAFRHVNGLSPYRIRCPVEISQFGQSRTLRFNPLGDTPAQPLEVGVHRLDFPADGIKDAAVKASFYTIINPLVDVFYATRPAAEPRISRIHATIIVTPR